MPVDTVKFLHGVTLAGTFISQIQNANVALNADILVSRGAGDPRPFFVAERGQSPEVTFTSTALATVLTAMGGQYGTDLSGGNCDMTFRAGTDLGSRSAIGNSDHDRFRMAQTFGYWSQISASHQQDAEISCSLIPTWNGSANPVVYTGSVAVSGDASGNEMFTLGPTLINGDEIYGVQQATVSSGLSPLVRGSSGERFNTFACAQAVEPTLQISGLNLPKHWSYTDGGTAVTSFVQYFRKKASTGANVANATSSHIKISGTAAIIRPMDASGDLSGEASSSFMLYITAADYSTAPLTISTASAIE